MKNLPKIINKPNVQSCILIYFSWFSHIFIKLLKGLPPPFTTTPNNDVKENFLTSKNVRGSRIVNGYSPILTIKLWYYRTNFRNSRKIFTVITSFNAKTSEQLFKLLLEYVSTAIRFIFCLSPVNYSCIQIVTYFIFQ